MPCLYEYYYRTVIAVLKKNGDQKNAKKTVKKEFGSLGVSSVEMINDYITLNCAEGVEKVCFLKQTEEMC